MGWIIVVYGLHSALPLARFDDPKTTLLFPTFEFCEAWRRDILADARHDNPGINFASVRTRCERQGRS